MIIRNLFINSIETVKQVKLTVCFGADIYLWLETNYFNRIQLEYGKSPTSPHL